jgi:ABC-type Na+ efflux pump permease subunit
VNQTKPGANASAPTVRTLWQRLRPFIRRDLKGRLISASIAALVIAGLSWFGISAFTHLDSADAHQLRVDLGLERPGEVCSSRPGVSNCSYDDRAQAKVDGDWNRDVRIRSAILQELDLRLEAALGNLEEASELLDRQEFDFGNGRIAGGDARLAKLLKIPDVEPLRWHGLYVDGLVIDDLLSAATFDAHRDESPAATRKLLERSIEEARVQLLDLRRTVDRQRSREPEIVVSAAMLDHAAMLVDLRVNEDRFDMTLSARDWFAASVSEATSRSAFNLANQYPSEFTQALLTNSEIWSGGWEGAVWGKQHKPTVRYHSPITDSTRYRLAGVVFLAIACFVFVVVSPIVTATATAREREAGTLPVLRMTGMSAGELALAMVVGPNVFAAVLGGSLLLGGLLLLAMTLPLAVLILPLFMLMLLAAATHLTAIGLGDALGQRVNAMVVGGLLGVGILIPGLLGGVLASFDVAATGLLLGPLPALTASVADISGIHGIGLSLSDDLTLTMLGYSLAIQVVLGLVCLNSWQRRVEQGWAPLFRPIEGVILALASIGCSALTLLDINNHHQAQDFDTLNLLTFLSSAFLLPLLAWLLVASLRRPARAHAVADHIEARRAFLRFQGFLALSTLLVGGTYHLVMNQAGLNSEDSEIMWATLTQLLLAAETGVATLLWASRRREGKLRVAFVGGAAVLMQLGAVLGTYGLEVEHVALTNSAASPLLLNAEISGYWLVFLVLCWAAGLTLIFTALLRRRDEKQAAAAQAEAAQAEADDDDDDGMPGRRLIH